MLLGNPVQPLEVVLIQLQLSMQLREGGFQLEGAQEERISDGVVTCWESRIDYQSITSRLLRSLADLLLISGRDGNLWGSTSESKACSF